MFVLIFVGLGAYYLITALGVDHWTVANGSVTEVAESTVGCGPRGGTCAAYAPTVQFTLNGQEMTATGKPYSTFYQVGQAVTVYVDPSDPRQISLQSPRDSLTAGLVLLAVGVAIAGVVGVLANWLRKLRSQLDSPPSNRGQSIQIDLNGSGQPKWPTQ